MTYAEFQERWEAGAKAELARYDAMPFAELLSRIQDRRLGDYYTIWSAMAKRASLAETAWLLFEVLESDLDYFHRYHCADALLMLAGLDDASHDAAHYSAREVFDVAENLQRLSHLVAERMEPGTRPQDPP